MRSAAAWLAVRIILCLAPVALVGAGCGGHGNGDGEDAADGDGVDAADAADGDGADAADAADGDGVDGGTDADDGPDEGADDLPASCLFPGPGPRTLTFTDVTEELGLGPTGLRATGTQVTVVDLNGDRWPDLALVKGSSAREDPAAPTGLYRLLENQGSGGFADRTWSSGLFDARDGTPGRAASLAVFGDLDGDGDQDAFLGVYETTDNQATLLDHSDVYLNDGQGGFTPGPERRFTSQDYDPVASAALFDYDRDGRLDLFTAHHYARYGYLETMIQDNLWRGLGGGSFEDATGPAGLTTESFSVDAAARGKSHRPSWGATACDLDGDGWDDLLVNSYGRMPNALYRNAGGSFEDLTMTSGYAYDADFNYTDNQFYACFCAQGLGDALYCMDAETPLITCQGNNWTRGVDDQAWRLGGNSATVSCGDVDGDGDLDLLTSEIAHWHIGQSSDKSELVLNRGFPGRPFTRPGNQVVGLTRTHVQSWNEGDLGSALVDLDNDGGLEALVTSSDYPGTYLLLWQHQADVTFREVGLAAGVRQHRAHGLAWVDYDRDGDYDLVVGTSLMRWSATDTPPPPEDAFVHVYRNEVGQDANRLLLHLVGAGGAGGANRDALGARVSVTAGGRRLVRERQGPHGLGGFQHDPLMIIGLGEACRADEVRVRWPNAQGSELVLNDVDANQVVWLEEGQPARFMSLEDYRLGR
jgi:enediyne biosynthesis protein E4